MHCCFPAGSDSLGSARTKGPSHREGAVVSPMPVEGSGRYQRARPWPHTGCTLEHKDRRPPGEMGKRDSCMLVGWHSCSNVPRVTKGACGVLLAWGVDTGGTKPQADLMGQGRGTRGFSPSHCPKNISWDVAAFIIDEDK